ncbi:nitrite reductase/ring-hydroxylating ferredoxin subunit [Lewinella aquimaris]|uniref:Nitrite reductase/ring-hydroxylating ferredoxin subunit n=1 Tax=Neolewinella aquimaris TaxID=1835722 RepID=A0A840E0D9_9BACT|nr:Rieske 2Fe-2S domain-containing protein [Neolewinella aquimaris]MBB4078691.1 nitrite reductase/ring-hydroxylating ferredoxin subunit [Neolewinella aquimaris]
MNRKDFLNNLGIGAAFALTATCLGGCSKEEDEAFTPTPSTGIDFTLDLNATENAPLATDGGYVVRNKIVVARTLTGDYVAATQQCSHEGNLAVQLRNDEWYCTVHGARYTLAGDGLNQFGSNGLTTYKTALNGTDLRVFS